MWPPLSHSNQTTTTFCSLSTLNQLGPYRLLDVKKLIGEYAGLQYGDYWKRLYDCIRYIIFCDYWPVCTSTQDTLLYVLRNQLKRKENKILHSGWGINEREG
mmetsp:Transcript_2295/g.2847  ORF Transcript_2295/g.2847 Transcript_2295/m.2847 type:complete len:102 (-) Transcript_2295:630-935(-)